MREPCNCGETDGRLFHGIIKFTTPYSIHTRNSVIPKRTTAISSLAPLKRQWKRDSVFRGSFVCTYIWANANGGWFNCRSNFQSKKGINYNYNSGYCGSKQSFRYKKKKNRKTLFSGFC